MAVAAPDGADGGAMPARPLRHRRKRAAAKNAVNTALEKHVDERLALAVSEVVHGSSRRLGRGVVCAGRVLGK